MNALETLSARLIEALSSPVPLLLAKITLLLAVAWLIHAALARQNPRWRVLMWRLAAIGCVLLAGLTACPPLFEWPVLPEAAAGDAAAVAENVGRPASGEAPQLTAAPARAAATEQGRGAAPEPPGAGIAESDPAVAPSPPVARSRTAASQPAPQADGRPADRGWSEWAMLVWCGGLGVLVLRTTLGAIRVRAICRRAAPVDGEVANRAIRIARDLGICSAAGATAGGRRDVCPTIRQSTHAPTPCLVGLCRPTILLPASPHHALDRDELTAVLAHELAHVRGRDLLWNAVLHALAHVLWFHPLAWRVRASHAAACDAVCDAVAADYLGDTAAYTRTLARLAVRVARPVTTAGLAMARPSNVRRRIEALRTHAVHVGLPRRRVVAFGAVGTMAAIALGGARLTQAEDESRPSAEAAAEVGERGDQAPESDVDQQTVPTLHTIIHATQKQDAKPLQDVRVRLQAWLDGEQINHRIQSDENGLATVPWRSDLEIEQLFVTAEKDGFVPVHYSWTSSQRSLEIPTRLDLQFEPGILVGGTIQDDAGAPIAGASVWLLLPSTGAEQAKNSFVAATLTTDANGKWEWPNAPKDLTDVRTRVEHPLYLLGHGGVMAGRNNVVVLERGLELAGRVLDTQSQPIMGARVSIDQRGEDPNRAVTDNMGRFVLYKCKPGITALTVQADGYAPQIRDVEIGDANEDHEFRLESGNPLLVRVLGPDGNPVEGVRLAAASWHGYGTLAYWSTTDAEGRIEWRSAPPDEVHYNVTKAGYMAIRQLPVSASPEEQVITLRPELVIEGKVIDAVTGEPIPYFQIERGDQRSDGYTSWSRDEPAVYTDGAYTFRIDHVSDGYVLRLVAPGYLPSESRTFEPNEGRQTYDFKLQPGQAPSGVVLLPRGEPASGAEVALATRRKQVLFRNGYFNHRQMAADVVTADAAGRFAFLSPGDDEDYAIFVVHDEGVAHVTREEFQASNRITLQPWGRVEGSVVIGAEPGASRDVSFFPTLEATGKFAFSPWYTTQSDADGTFSLDRVIPGPGTLARVLVRQLPSARHGWSGWQVHLTVPSGDTSRVQIGGSGRPLTGQIQLDRPADSPIDWTENEPVSVERWDPETDRRARPIFRYVSNVDEKGRFHIPDVPAGRYRLTLQVNARREPNSSEFGDPIGKATIDFSVPKMPSGRSDEPLDLGVITAKLLD